MLERKQLARVAGDLKAQRRTWQVHHEPRIPCLLGLGHHVDELFGFKLGQRIEHTASPLDDRRIRLPIRHDRPVAQLLARDGGGGTSQHTTWYSCWWPIEGAEAVVAARNTMT